jgi:HlyD family secretion protein
VIVHEAIDVLKAPTSSLFRHGEKWAVFKAENGRALLRIIEIGPRNENEVQVLKGLSQGDVVIVHPSDSIKDGVRIAPREK